MSSERFLRDRQETFLLLQPMRIRYNFFGNGKDRFSPRYYRPFMYIRGYHAVVSISIIFLYLLPGIYNYCVYHTIIVGIIPRAASYIRIDEVCDIQSIQKQQPKKSKPIKMFELLKSDLKKLKAKATRMIPKIMRTGVKQIRLEMVSQNHRHHWSNEDWEKENEPRFVTAFHREGGSCYGMSLSWLYEIFHERASKESMPSILRSIIYQDVYMHFHRRYILNRIDEEQMRKGIKDSLEANGRNRPVQVDYFERYETRKEMISGLWSKAEEGTGYIMCSNSGAEGEDGHAAGFIKFWGRGYLMLPNAGLYSSRSLEQLNELMLEDPVFLRMEDNQGLTFAYSFKWNKT